MNPDIERIQQWANQYENCAVNNVPSEILSLMPETDSLGDDFHDYIADYDRGSLRFCNGDVVGWMSGEYSRALTLFNDLDTYIDFRDLPLADEAPIVSDINIEEVL